jgi:UDP-D-galactose:(glucosyl)LPS alpha-1,3-D-galactosyltransferase
MTTPVCAEEALHISFAVDAAYVEHAAIAVESILRFPYPDRPTLWMVLAGDVGADLRDQIARSVGRRAELRFIEPETERRFGLSGDRSTTHVSEAMYLRLQLVDLLPASVERVLYLDADVLCTSPGLETLFSVDLHGKTVGAVRDAFTRRMGDHGALPLLPQLERIDAQDMYFNSGVLLIDTRAWREREVRRRAEQYLDDSAETRRFPDQDALNVACHGDWHRLDKRWNHMMAWRLEGDAADLLSQAVIIHSAGPLKPWHSDFPPGRRLALYTALADRVRTSSAPSAGR